jgi:D-alanyl-D-alanine carboxypeptidase/D-alanyl-D-alanine-endopeptidase (penicillin-binding protein 4)
MTGTRALREVLARAGLPVDQLASVDGSGLDRSDRASCGLLLQAIERAGPMGDVAAGLPVAAKNGTLAKRFQGHPAAGRLRAKTGSLDGVTGLTGFVDASSAGAAPLAFALLGNGLPTEAVGRGLQESVAKALAAYPDAPNPKDLGP